ncbi:hybrid sensor histidine kinase/response regulator [Paenibacillus sp. DYY-L-2]|uniref:hybrid sensor histidine kinase/response regulator n=1 Tax=Paenibacillus sp. DYY-L-2 TaxID=3447013 RepID=UPI003F4FB86D
MFKKRRLYIVLLGVVITVFLALYYAGQAYLVRNADSPKVQQGVIDLTGWDFTNDGPVKLQGSWQFYWNQLLSSPPHGKLTGYMDVPGQWNRSGFPVNGGATYRLLIKVKPSDMIYGMRISNAQMASAVYVDGVERGRSGRPAVTKSGYTPENKPYTFYFPIEGGTAEVLLQAANFDFIQGGITNNIEFGSMDAISRLDRRITGMDIVVIVALGMVGLYHIGVFLKRRQDKSLLYFGAYCIVAGFAFACLSERLFTQVLYMLPFEFSHKLQLVAIYGSIIVITLFLRTICPDIVPAWFFRAVFMVFGSFVLIGLIFPFYLYSHVTFIFSTLQVVVYLGIIWMLSTSREDRYGNFSRQSILILILAFYALLISLIDNSLYILAKLPNNYLGIVSMMVFAILVSLMLSFRFSDAYKTIEVMSVKLLESDRLKDEFLVKTSHEFQTPLNGIINISQSMIDGRTAAGSDHHRLNLTVIQESAKRLSTLVGDILDMERIRRNDLALHPTAVDVRVTVSIVLEVMGHLSTDKDIRILNRIPGNLPPVHADENRLRQVLLNLIGNAIKFTERGYVEITAERIGDDQIKVVVKDTGIGIEHSDWTAVFQPFMQAEEEKSQGYGGVGLGLSISRQLVHMMKGDIFIEASEPGAGTRIAFVLPVSEESPPPAKPARSLDGVERKGAKLETAAAVDTHPGMFTLLAVDDEPANLQVLRNIFSEKEFVLHTATNGREALCQLKENAKIDLVLLDVMMPQLSGYEVCREIREKYTLFDMPVIMLTVRNAPQDLAAGFAAGANDFIVKPFNAMEVTARVKTLLKLKTSVREALDSEMAFLQSQIKPHFLFNALNAILSICYTDGARAARLINHLSHYLRRSFDISSTDQFVRIREEIKLVESYVEIEKARFEDRLNVYYDIDDSLLDCRILPLTIQPLVENAIRHGLMRRKHGGQVRLSIKAGAVEREQAVLPEPDFVHVEVWDNGLGIAPEKIAALLGADDRHPEKSGVGLKNIQRRLQVFFGQGLDMTSEEGEWTRVQFRFKTSRSGNSTPSDDV